jgi:RNA polymerase sigma factor (sigma-70 family)
MLLRPDSLALENKTGATTHGLSELQLLRDAKRGRAEAFEALCQTLTPRLYKTALRITQNREDAEDAVQDSLMRAYMHIKSFQGNSSFSTWLTRIVMNSALMIRRKNRNARQVSADDLGRPDEPGLHLQIPDHAPNPEQNYVEQERKAILHKAIRKLRPRMRAVVEVAQFQELPIKETAKVLDISVAAAKGRFFHARAALRKSMALRAVAQARTEPAA